MAIFGNWKYKLINDGKEVNITKYLNNKISEAVPSEIMGYPVTSIEDSAFWGCSSLTSINIPKSVTSIGGSAFRGCSSLKEINLDENNITFTVLENVLFNKAKTVLIYYPAGKPDKSYKIPESVTSIGDSAFEGCSSLTSINIPESVTSIEDNAFRGCFSLVVKGKINSNAHNFANKHHFQFFDEETKEICKNNENKGTLEIKKINNQNKNYYIITKFLDAKEQYNRKKDCEYIDTNSSEYLNIQDIQEIHKIIITAIAERAFSGCNLLKEVEIPSSIEYIGSFAFDSCLALKEIKFLHIKKEDVETPRNLYIGEGAFSRCRSLETIAFPKEVKFIGDYLFYGCDKLKKINLKGNIYSIGNWAFSGCKLLEEIVFPVNIPIKLVSIHDGAFWGCTSLSIAPIFDSLASIGTAAFYKCEKLKYIKIPKNIKSLRSWTFAECKSLATVYIYNPNSLSSFGDGVFFGCTSLKQFKDDILSYIDKLDYNQKGKWIFSNFQTNDSQSLEINNLFQETNSFERTFSYFMNYIDITKFENINILFGDIENIQSKYTKIKKCLFNNTWKNYDLFKNSLFNTNQKNLQDCAVDKILNRLLNTKNTPYETTIPPYKELYRARVIKDQDHQENIQISSDNNQFYCDNGLLYNASFSNKEYELGFNENNHREPIFSKAGGRNNYNEISYLYLAEDEETTIAELRPAINSEISLAVFKTLKPLKLFDLTEAIDEFAVVYEPQKNESGPKQFKIKYNGRIESKNIDLYKDYLFLVKFALDYNIHFNLLIDLIVQELHRPAYDTETDYRVSQYIADRIQKAGFDGIRYSSSRHKSGVNITLFHSSSSYLTFIGSTGKKIENIDIKY